MSTKPGKTWVKTVARKGFIRTTWEIKTYDVWGNAKDGYDVNDVYGGGEVAIDLRVETANAGTPQAFDHASLTDAQIRSILGLGKVQIDTDGDDLHVTVNRRHDGYPVGELNCTSHASLSPIRDLEVANG